MGFRNKHRRGRGGFGGGGGHHHHHHGFGTGEPNGLQPGDDIGNRRSFKPVIVPPDDIGNRKDPEEAEWIPVDDVGNRIDAAPTHELSGVLLELEGKRRRRRPKGVSAPERVGRYFIGGVNPLIATTTPRPFPGKTLEESLQGQQSNSGYQPGWEEGDAAGPSSEGGPVDERDARDGEGRDNRDGRRDDRDDDRRGGRRRRGRGGRDQVDGMAAQEVSERRAQRFFDFEEDDRFDYTLKTSPEQKRKDAEDAVRNIVVESGRDATVLARLIDDGKRPKILVTIDERGPAPSLPPERRSQNANEPLFVMGNAALMSLNYLVNKIVNRYPDDRIRLAILPANDERLYLDALAEHQKVRRPEQFAAGTKPNVEAVPQASAPHDVVVATPVPVGPGAPPEAFDQATEPASREAAAHKSRELVEAEQHIAEKVKASAHPQAPAAAATEPTASTAAPAQAGDDDGNDGDEPAADSADEASDEEAPRGRPKKAKAAATRKPRAASAKAMADDDDEPKKPRGRPRKSTPVVERATVKPSR